MNLKTGFNLALAVILLGISDAVPASTAPRMVPVATKPGAEWKTFSTRTLDDLPAVAAAPADADLSQYGGLLARKEKATGFFHTAKVGDRWWLVDPDGCLCLNVGVAGVKMIPTPGARAALAAKFGSESNWAAGTTTLLRRNGFNAVGAWSDTTPLRAVAKPLVYTTIWNFMSSYGKKRGGTYQQPGHTGYPNDCIFVFDPAFEIFCDDYAKQLAADKDDPWLLGHFSDNELPFKPGLLTNYLALPAGDPGHKAAWDFLQSRHGAKAATADITERDKSEFLTLVAQRYFRIVSSAIKKYDPNHLYLGPRLHGMELLRCPEFFKAIGPFLDVVSVNYYRVWTPDSQVAMWSHQAQKPVLITEWYAKGIDSGMPNNGGAGWLVKTQRERGQFYQNFTLGLLESKVCVGWHWFRYSDNDLDDKTVDPSNRDSNKGIVNNRYEPYAPLLAEMKSLNEHVYSLVDYFDGTFTNRTDKRSLGEKGD